MADLRKTGHLCSAVASACDHRRSSACLARATAGVDGAGHRGSISLVGRAAGQGPGPRQATSGRRAERRGAPGAVSRHAGGRSLRPRRQRGPGGHSAGDAAIRRPASLAPRYGRTRAGGGKEPGAHRRQHARRSHPGATRGCGHGAGAGRPSAADARRTSARCSRLTARRRRSPLRPRATSGARTRSSARRRTPCRSASATTASCPICGARARSASSRRSCGAPALRSTSIRPTTSRRSSPRPRRPGPTPTWPRAALPNGSEALAADSGRTCEGGGAGAAVRRSIRPDRVTCPSIAAFPWQDLDPPAPRPSSAERRGAASCP